MKAGRNRIHLFSGATLLYALVVVLIVTRLLYEGTGRGIWNGVQVLFVVWGVLLLCVKGTFILKSQPLRSLVVFSLYIWFLSFFSLDSFDISGVYYFLMIPFAGLLTIVTYYSFKGVNIADYSLLSIFLFLVISVLVYSRGNAAYISMDDAFMGINSYYLVLLIPLVLVSFKTPWSYIPFIITIILVAFTNKRAGLIAVILEAAFYSLSLIKDRRKLLFAIVGVVLAGFIVIRLYDYVSGVYGIDVLTRLQSIEEDGGSGRSDMWNRLLRSFWSCDFFNIAFGNGYGSAHAFLGTNVHNDFLQIMYDYGLFALLLYALFYFRMFLEANKMKKRRYPYSTHFLISIIASLFIALSSFLIIEPRVVTCSALVWGVLLAGWDSYKKDVLING